jgi:hypothetical protein
LTINGIYGKIFSYRQIKLEVFMADQAVTFGIKGVCPDCGETVSLTPNPKLQKPDLRPKIEQLIKEQGLGERGEYWTVEHTYPAKGSVRAGSCFGGLCPSRLIRNI